MKKSIFIAGMAIAMVSCGNAESNIEKSERATVSVETAIIDGRDAGRMYVINKHRSDTVAANKYMKRVRMKYDTLADKQYVNAFDTAMLHTINTYRPSMREIAPR
ncbi:MAG: hypothetical protein K2K97_03930 [Muribaculaceae bacterium]|nr:hypothetical protein [Muribaculaceae bacterium]